MTVGVDCWFLRGDCLILQNPMKNLQFKAQKHILRMVKEESH